MARIRSNNDSQSHRHKKADSLIVWLIAVYIRLSKEDSDREGKANRIKDESDSIVNQRKILDEFIERHFAESDESYEIVEYYIDDGLTGTDDTRKDFMRMIQDVEAGMVNCMVCKTTSRAFRNYADQGYYLEQYFPLKKTRFISMGDPYVDTYKNPDVLSGLELPISGLMNDRYASKTSNDVRRTFAMKRRKGEFIGAFPPYGYLKDPLDKNHLILDPATYPIKREIFGWIAYDGMSYRGCAMKLNELGIPNPSAYKQSLGWKYNNPHAENNDGMWQAVCLKRLMLDPVNLGHMVQGRQRVISYKVHTKETIPKSEWEWAEDTHDPTFTQEEYDTLVRLSKRDTRTANTERMIHLFSGLVRCADCNRALQRSKAKHYVYYTCRTYRNKSVNACTKHTIPETELNAAVLAAIQAQIAMLESLAPIVDKINEAPVVITQSERIDKMLRDKQKEITKAQSIADGLFADWKNGDITREEYQRLKAKYVDQIQQCNDALKSLEAEQKRLGAAINSENAVFTLFLKHRNLQELDRAVLAELVDFILVHEDRCVTIRFRFSDELERMMEYIEVNQLSGTAQSI